MKVAIVGSRNWGYHLLYDEMLRFHNNITIDEVVSGGAEGADKLAEKWARVHNIPCKVYQPNWKSHGNSAGAIRNQDIVNYADIIMAFVIPIRCGYCNGEGTVDVSQTASARCVECNGKAWLPTAGTAITLRMAVEANKPTYVFTPDGKQYEWCKGE